MVLPCFSKSYPSLSGHGFSPSFAVLARLDKRPSLGPGLGCIKAQQAPLRLGPEEITAKPKLASALTLASSGPLFQQAGEGLCEGVDVAGPSCRNIVTVLNDKGRPRVIHGIALQAGGLSPVFRIGFANIEEVRRRCELSRHLLLHRHVAVGVIGLFEIGPVVVRVPEPRDAGEFPGAVFECPCQRRRLVAVKNRMVRSGRTAARGQQNTMTDRGDRLLRLEEIGNVTLEYFAFEIVAHAARAMPA